MQANSFTVKLADNFAAPSLVREYTSKAMDGRAADIRAQGIPVETLAACAETLLPDTGGIGRYPVKKGRPAGWVHVDVRKTKSRWVG